MKDWKKFENKVNKQSKNTRYVSSKSGKSYKIVYAK